jgi:hypothetical protein
MSKLGQELQACMPPVDWNQWAQERPSLLQEDMLKAFWWFMDQNWKDSLTVVSADLIRKQGQTRGNAASHLGAAEASCRS